MISDVLSQTEAAILAYQRDMPDAYAEVARELRVLLAILAQSRGWLDSSRPHGAMLDAAKLRSWADWLEHPDLPFPT